MTYPIRSQRGAQMFAVLATLLVIVLAAGAGYWFGMRKAVAPMNQATGTIAPSGAAGAGATAGRKILYWHDPMVPDARFDKPGKSPYMDMDLVPVYADEQTGSDKISISPRVVQNFGVRSVAAHEGRLASTFSAVGLVTVDERLLEAVQSRSLGWVERLLVRAQYDPVTKGQPLVDLYLPEWLSGEEELLALKASHQPGAQELVEAARQRLRLLAMPDEEIARAEREGKPRARVTMFAPSNGIVWEIGIRDGVAVTPGMTLFKLAGLQKVWVNADVPEAQAAAAREGQTVEARTATYPDRVFKGTVTTVLPEVNTATRTLRARIELVNPGEVLKPGMYATVMFGGDEAPPSVLIPSEALIRTGTRDVVIADLGQGKFEPVAVEVGRESEGQTEILKGLASGQRVVVSGQFMIDSEASLKGALARLTVGANQGGQSGTDGAMKAMGAGMGAADTTTSGRSPMAAPSSGASPAAPPAAGRGTPAGSSAKAMPMGSSSPSPQPMAKDMAMPAGGSGAGK